MKVVGRALDALMLGSGVVFVVMGWEGARNLCVLILGLHIVLTALTWALLAIIAALLVFAHALGGSYKGWESTEVPSRNWTYRAAILAVTFAVSACLAVLGSPVLALVLLVTELASSATVPAARAVATQMRKMGAKG